MQLNSYAKLSGTENEIFKKLDKERMEYLNMLASSIQYFILFFFLLLKDEGGENCSIIYVANSDHGCE